MTQFGSRRTARFEPKGQAAKRAHEWPASVTATVTSKGEGVTVVRCPPDPFAFVTLGVPVSVTLELLGLPVVGFEANLLARGTDDVSIWSYVPLFGVRTAVWLGLDADDLTVQVERLVRKDLPEGLFWSSLCSAQPDAYVTPVFGSIPAPIVSSTAPASFDCSKASETIRSAPSGTTSRIPFLLTRVDTRGCRSLGRDNFARFSAEVSAVDAAWMPRPAPASLVIDLDQGHTHLTFDSELPPSDWLRSRHTCPRPPTQARLSYRLDLEHGNAGPNPKSEVFELLFSCDDIHVRCSPSAQ